MAGLFINSFSLLSLATIFSIFALVSLRPIFALSTVSISHTSNQTLICALDQESHLNCTSFPLGIEIPLSATNVSFKSIVGGNGFLCGLIESNESIMVCWRFGDNGVNMLYRRVYRGPNLDELEAGDTHVCGLVSGTNQLECWQWERFGYRGDRFYSSIGVGENFVCGLLENGGVRCLGGNSSVTNNVPSGSFSLVDAGSSYACGINVSGGLVCWGDMMGESPQGVFVGLALGENRSCAIRRNRTVVCWGEMGFDVPEGLREMPFESIEAKRGVFCGILTANFSLYCWGNSVLNSDSVVFRNVMPGPCRSECPCDAFPNYSSFCREGLMICEPCAPQLQNEPFPLPPSLPTPAPPRSARWNKRSVAFLVVGCVGSVSSMMVMLFLFLRYCKVRGCQVHDSGPLEENGMPALQPGGAQRAPPVLEKRLSQLFSMGNGSHLEEFSFQLLLKATDNFSDEHKIGNGSFGSVYHATLEDGREVAIKRAELSASSSYADGTKRQEDKDNAFLNELEFLSRLNHKNLVRLLGFCEESTELVLVYEHMNNGSLHDHLHKLKSSPLMSWAMRIKVALDAARGIEYLHVYAVPQIIHRDIKSSNILLDASWTAKVSDFGLSLMGPKDDESHLSLGAAGTVGYMDPEYYRLQLLTTKSDVYSFGVVLLELLSGYRAIHKNGDGVPRNVVDFMVPYIVQDEIHRVLDPKVPPPTPYEIEAVAYIGYLAADCVTHEGKDRPTMTEIVNSLERALTACLATSVISRSTSRSST